MKVIAEKNKSKIARFSVSFDAGSKVEHKTRFPLGTSHFVEHMAFKGYGDKKAKDISDEISFYGGEMNAYTSHENICFTLSCPVENADVCFEEFSKMITNCEFNEEDMEKERAVILEELSMINDSDHHHMYSQAYSILFQNYMATPVIGFEETIKKITLEHLKAFKARFLKPQKAIVTVTSSMSKKEATNLVKKYLPYGRGSYANKFNFEQNEFPESTDITVERDGLQGSMTAIYFPGYSESSKKGVLASMVMYIIGGGFGSRLFQTVREDNGLVYSIYGNHVSYSDSGLSSIHFESKKENIEKIVELTVEEIYKLCEEGLQERELQTCKNSLLKTSYEMEDSPWYRSGEILKESISDVIKREDYFNIIRSATEEDIISVAKEVFLSDRMVKVFCFSGEGDEG